MPSGKLMPLNPDPIGEQDALRALSRGSLVALRVDDRDQVVARTVGRGGGYDLETETMFASHFATCRYRDQHRRP